MTDRAEAYDYDALIRHGRGELFGEGFALLPAPPMLMFDRITRVTREGGPHGKGEVIAELDIKPDLWFFECHFIGDPVMPGCLGVDALWQLTGFFLGWAGMKGKGRALGAGEIKFTEMVMPDSKLVRYEVDMKRVIDRRLKMGVADGRMFVDDVLAYTVNDMRVGLFGAEEAAG